MTNIILIGCGKMGAALLKAWLNGKIQATFSVIDPAPLEIPDIKKYESVKDAQTAIKNAQMIILAVKPQTMPEVCAGIKPYLPPQTAILSIAAGQSLPAFARYFSPSQPVIRAMPNTPAAIGKGISVAVTNTHATPEQKTLAETLLRCAGQFEWVEDEALLDAVTALSGSGPAYVFYMIEALAKAGQQAGLEKTLAEKLARQTVIGAAALAEHQSDTPPSTLRENVTSPGGTTAAALEILMDGRWQDILTKAVKAAKKRSEELNSA